MTSGCGRAGGRRTGRRWQGAGRLSPQLSPPPPSWVFLHEKAYQVRDTVIESSVVTKVKGIGKYGNRVLDTADYVTPPQAGDSRDPPPLPRALIASSQITPLIPKCHGGGVQGGRW